MGQASILINQDVGSREYSDLIFKSRSHLFK
jgi:hypothetical protein